MELEGLKWSWWKLIGRARREWDRPDFYDTILAGPKDRDWDGGGLQRPERRIRFHQHRPAGGGVLQQVFAFLVRHARGCPGRRRAGAIPPQPPKPRGGHDELQRMAGCLLQSQLPGRHLSRLPVRVRHSRPRKPVPTLATI